MRLLNIVGARPQFIKHSVMQKQFQHYGIEEILVHTGQHCDDMMSSVFFETLQINPPHYHLKSVSLGAMLEALKKELADCDFDAVLVYGDTTSTLAGALYAKERKKLLVHIEAGLRSYDMQMPEEINRVLTDRIADFLFAPTEIALNNLKLEGFWGDRGKGCAYWGGDVMEDAFRFYSKSAICPDGLETSGDFVVCTMHRQSNVDDRQRLEFLLQGLGELQEQIVLPLHPRTLHKIQTFDLTIPTNCVMLPPQGYFEMLWLLQNAKAVITDSGGLQKEAFFAGKPCLVLRDCSEWMELVQKQASILLGNETLPQAYQRMLGLQVAPLDLYGGGKSVDRILSTLKANIR
ncbi:UDP-N-acetylglucosamine 2-epimerase [Helicobacter enhydrae]|uniref:UDP-N-acetylglucosamine 2-epimerase n=1 Tax=Helicobacter enhydrae TaxID=222136 RepID=A0A1B1U5T9_9HELI|nr:UDP-N-acetylglucosamine 2-epimerase (non-hydrolyzing) [Helicobacter enhydrae]ANV98143.1 UDP-N-acetylglucosamine 2-epimerase [Helicobacter enhydrae]